MHAHDSTGDITQLWIVNRTREVDPLTVFVDEDQALEYAARYPDAVVTREIVMNRAARGTVPHRHRRGRRRAVR